MLGLRTIRWRLLQWVASLIMLGAFANLMMMKGSKTIGGFLKEGDKYSTLGDLNDDSDEKGRLSRNSQNITNDGRHFQKLDSSNVNLLMKENINSRQESVNDWKMDGLKFEMRSERKDTKHEWGWPRIMRCDRTQYDLSKMPTVSVILTFHKHEELVDVLHTVHSIIQRSPLKLLQEIILVDDYSQKEDFQKLLENYIASVFGDKVRILRAGEPLGLIKARLRGIRAARGEVIVSMDSHMEVQQRWLEPLLSELKKNPKTLAASYLDWMEKEKDGRWTIRHGASTWKTYFDWNFVFGFQDIPEHEKALRRDDPSQPIESPVTIGTLFAIRKDFFQSIGEFDENMEGWGGENLDLPIRVWLCGGRVINVPCSHAAHLEKHGHRNYRISWGDKINKNYKRVAEVWLDSYSKYFYMYNPYIQQKIEVGNITSRLLLKEKCNRDFKWYLDNIFPELGIPDIQGFAWGGVTNRRYNTCLCWRSGSIKVSAEKCTRENVKRQGFFWDTDGNLRFPVHVFNVHKDDDGQHLTPKEYIPVHRTDKTSKWIHWKGGLLMLFPGTTCLQALTEFTLTMAVCDANDSRQRWNFAAYTPQYTSLEAGKLPHRNSLSFSAKQYYQTLLKTVQNSILGK